MTLTISPHMRAAIADGAAVAAGDVTYAGVDITAFAAGPMGFSSGVGFGYAVDYDGAAAAATGVETSVSGYAVTTTLSSTWGGGAGVSAFSATTSLSTGLSSGGVVTYEGVSPGGLGAPGGLWSGPGGANVGVAEADAYALAGNSLTNGVSSAFAVAGMGSGGSASAVAVIDLYTAG